MDEETTRCRLGCCVVAGRTGGRDGEGAVCLGFLMSGSQRFQLKVLDALEIELSRIFLYGPAAGGDQGRRQASLNRLPSICRMAVEFPARRFVRVDSKILSISASHLSGLSSFIWTGHDANLFSTVVTRRPRVPPSCSKRIWFGNLGGHKMEGRAWASVPRPCMVILLRPGKRFRS